MLKNRLALCVMGATLCAAGPAFAGDGTNLMKMISADSQIVLVFDVADSRDSALLQKGYDSLLSAKPEAKAKLAEIGLDPMKDIDTVLFAGNSAAGDLDNMQNMVVIVEGRIPKDRLATMPGVKASTYLGTTIWSKDDTDVAMVGDKLFFTKKDKMKGAIDIALGKGKGKGASAAASKKGAALRAAVAGTDTKADLWLTVLVPAKTKADMKADQGMTAEVVSVGVNFTAAIGVALRVITDTEASAGKAVGMLQSQLATLSQTAGTFGFAKAAKSLTVAQDKAAINLSLTVTEGELQSLMKLGGLAAAGASGGATAPPPSMGGSKPMTGTSTGTSAGGSVKPATRP